MWALFILPTWYIASLSLHRPLDIVRRQNESVRVAQQPTQRCGSTIWAGVQDEQNLKTKCLYILVGSDVRCVVCTLFYNTIHHFNTRKRPTMFISTIQHLLFATVSFGTLISATTYAQFCDDTECSENCGISVSVDNAGCLTQKGRQSVKFHGTNLVKADLVSSPGDTCDCQNYCYDELVVSDGRGPGCFPLTGPSAESYRFITNQACEMNNC